jgi:hypothetical protein
MVTRSRYTLRQENCIQPGLPDVSFRNKQLYQKELYQMTTKFTKSIVLNDCKIFQMAQNILTLPFLGPPLYAQIGIFGKKK